MKCVCCGEQIGRKDARSYWRNSNGVKKYGCSHCNGDGTFDRWIDAQAKIESDRQINKDIRAALAIFVAVAGQHDVAHVRTTQEGARHLLIEFAANGYEYEIDNGVMRIDRSH